MKVQVEADSQEEFDEKRPELIRAIAGEKYDVELIQKGRRIPDSPRRSALTAQNQMVKHWDARLAIVVEQIKSDIDEIISNMTPRHSVVKSEDSEAGGAKDE